MRHILSPIIYGVTAECARPRPFVFGSFRFPPRVQVLFAKQNRAQVRSVTLSGVNSAGHSVFTTPPLFDSAFGHAFATQVPVVNWMTLVSAASCDAPKPSQLPLTRFYLAKRRRRQHLQRQHSYTW
jgi:hypothetical protein